MRLSSLIVVAAAAASAWIAPAGRTAVLDTQITSLPSTVTQGGRAHLAALSVGSRSCSLTVRYANGMLQSVGMKRTVVFGVAWTWRVPPTAPPGTAHAVLACGSAGRAQQAFTVAPQLLPARLVVAKSGVTNTVAGASYGIVLVNSSPTSAAIDVKVVIDLRDRAGRVLRTDTRDVAAIPAKGTYYLGGMSDATGVASVRPTLRVGGSKPTAVGATLVSTVRITPHADDDGAYADGQVTNRGSATLPTLTPVSAVFFDGAGRVIGGGVTFLPSALEPGASATFELSTTVSAAAIASALVSIG